MTRKKIDVFGLALTSACLLWAIILCITDFDWWTFGGTMFVAGLIVLSWILIRRSKPVDHKHPNNHRVDICEGCDPVCYAKDGAPLSWTDWFTHFRPQGTVSEMAKEYDDYLSHKKFRNYPRP